MKLTNMPERVTDWARLGSFEVPGISGVATIRMEKLGDAQLRVIEYGPGYLADHWCTKGHVVFAVKGALTSEHQGGQPDCEISAGMTWCVADDEGPPHRVRSDGGAMVFVLD